MDDDDSLLDPTKWLFVLHNYWAWHYSDFVFPEL